MKTNYLKPLQTRPPRGRRRCRTDVFNTAFIIYSRALGTLSYVKLIFPLRRAYRVVSEKSCYILLKKKMCYCAHRPVSYNIIYWYIIIVLDNIFIGNRVPLVPGNHRRKLDFDILFSTRYDRRPLRSRRYRVGEMLRSRYYIYMWPAIYSIHSFRVPLNSVTLQVCRSRRFSTLFCYTCLLVFQEINSLNATTSSQDYQLILQYYSRYSSLAIPKSRSFTMVLIMWVIMLKYNLGNIIPIY